WWTYLATGLVVVFLLVVRALTAGYRPERAARPERAPRPAPRARPSTAPGVGERALPSLPPPPPGVERPSPEPAVA
ncbi:MAG: hypothetical protein ACXWX2_07355, partial [Actinomycetota bacterium]